MLYDLSSWWTDNVTKRSIFMTFESQADSSDYLSDLSNLRDLWNKRSTLCTISCGRTPYSCSQTSLRISLLRTKRFLSSSRSRQKGVSRLDRHTYQMTLLMSLRFWPESSPSSLIIGTVSLKLLRKMCRNPPHRFATSLRYYFCQLPHFPIIYIASSIASNVFEPVTCCAKKVFHKDICTIFAVSLVRKSPHLFKRSPILSKSVRRLLTSIQGSISAIYP